MALEFTRMLYDNYPTFTPPPHLIYHQLKATIDTFNGVRYESEGSLEKEVASRAAELQVKMCENV